LSLKTLNDKSWDRTTGTKGLQVPTGTIKTFEPKATATFVLRRASFAITMQPNSTTNSTSRKSTNKVVEIRSSVKNAEREGIAIRGLLVAFAFEFVTGLGVYTMWHAWHLTR
jgi:hypothetical protein